MADSVKFYVLVAGHEYSKKGLDFDRMCTHRAQEIITTYQKAVPLIILPPVTLRFLRFHVSKGTIEFIDYNLKVTGNKVAALTESSWKLVSTFSGGSGADPAFDPSKICTSRTMRAIAASDYDTAGNPEYPGFISDGDDADQVMSIVDVYSAVQKMPANSLMELSFFCHGFPGGPILVNSSEDSDTPSDERDPADKDGRAKKDFLQDMGAGSNADTLKPFRDAFTAVGFIKPWGCVAVPAVRHVLSQAYVKRRLQTDAVGKALHALKPIDDTQTFDFDFSDTDKRDDGTPRPWTNDYRVDHTFFPTDVTQKTFTKTFLDIKQLLGRLNKRTYAFAAAKATGGEARSAFYGMEGDDEKTKKFNLMRVCINMSHEPPPPPGKKQVTECPVGYAPYLQFMQTYLNLRYELVRGYAIFDAFAVIALDELVP